MEEWLSTSFDEVDSLSPTPSTQGPTMAGPGGKFSNLRSSDAWKVLFLNHILHIESKIWEL